METFPVGMRVLVVDDDPLCLLIVGKMLGKCRYVATTSASATEALALLKQSPCPYDIVLTDVCLPDIDGFKLLEEIGLQLAIPVIMMSSNGDTTVRGGPGNPIYFSGGLPLGGMLLSGGPQIFFGGCT